MLEDAYDILRVLVNAVSKSGAIGEALHMAVHDAIDRIDPKIEARRQAAEAQAAAAAQEYQEFLDYQKYKAAQAAQAPAAPAQAPAAPVAFSSAPPVVP